MRDREQEHRHGHGHPVETACIGDGSSGDGHARNRSRLVAALAITLVFMVAEALGGYFANSQALMADAGHMLSDAGSILLSLLAIHFSARPATGRKSYGWMRLEILAALANGVVLVLIAGAIFWGAADRLRSPPQVDVKLMIGTGVLGLVANLASARVLHEPHHGHLNVHAAYVHVLGDVLGAAGAVAAGLIMWRTGWTIADPIVAVLVGFLILASSVRICRQAGDILLEAVPAHIDLDALARELSAAKGVHSIHDLHVWTISSGVHLMTCHAVVGDHGDHHDLLERLCGIVRDRFGIHHSTIQLECEDRSPHEEGMSFCERGGPC